MDPPLLIVLFQQEIIDFKCMNKIGRNHYPYFYTLTFDIVLISNYKNMYDE